MRYRELAPPDRFKSLVAGLWAFPATGHAHRVLPDGCMDIVVIDGRARLVGTMQRAIVVRPSADAVLGIRFRPGEVARLFSGLPGELTDADSLLHDVWGADGRRLEDGLLAVVEDASRRALDADAIVRRALPIVEQALQQRLATRAAPADLPVRAAALLLGQGLSVREAAQRTHLSERHLARRFIERVGVSPRTFARVRRLQRAALELQRGGKPAQAAVLVGYADQAHFTREANALAGATPATLSRELCDGLDTSVPVVL